jgi:tetratricopeptide (TPR) repeat protein
MTEAAGRPAHLAYRAAFFAGGALLAVSCAVGLARAVAGRAGLPGLNRIDAGAAAESYHAAGDLAAAARELRMVTAIDPGDCRSFDTLANVLARSGDDEGSLRVSLRHVGLHPYSPSAHARLGLAFQRLARLSEAYGSYSMAVRLNPGEASALAALGDIARQRGRLDEAVTFYERALALGMEAANLHNKLAIAHALAGRRDRALRHFDEALRLDPGFPDARTNRALLLQAGGAAFQAP